MNDYVGRIGMCWRRMRIVSALGVCVGWLAVGVAAGDVFVSGSSGHDGNDGSTWATAKRSIASAIDAASDGDTILVSNGVYALTQEIVVSKGVTIRGVGGAAQTIVDGNRMCRGFHIRHPGAILDGLSIRNGFSTNAGGGVCASPGGLIRNCRIYANLSSNSMARNVGGGIYLHGGTVENCLVYSNRTTSGYGGGGIYLEYGDYGEPAVRSCEIYGNHSYGSGGGVRCDGGGVVEDCSINDNDAYNGGGVRAAGGGTFLRCRIHHNVAWELNGGGAALAGGAMRNCTIYNNSSVRYGGGVFLWFNQCAFENCTVVGNTVRGSGGGVFVSSSGNEGDEGPCAVRNVIVHHNTAGSNGTDYACSTDTVFACDFSFMNPLPAHGVGNVGGDPLFLDEAAADFRLSARSPCVDAGTNLPWMSSATDCGGTVRIVNDRADMGAYEFRGGLWSAAVEAGNGWKWLAWFGFFWDVGNGWIFQPEHGWMYAIGDAESSIWFYTLDLGWMWSGSNVYPWVWRASDGAWLYYFRETRPRVFWNGSTGQFEWH